jgi:hypothetical protein
VPCLRAVSFVVAGRYWRRHTVDGALAAQLLQHFGSSGQSVAGFTDGDVEDEFLDAQIAHGIVALLLRLFVVRKRRYARL